MSLSLGDVDQYSTDSDDEEYVPGDCGGVSSDDDVAEGKVEDLPVSEDGRSMPQEMRTKGKRRQTHPRKMKGRVSTEEDGKGEEDGYRKEEKKEEREQDKLKEKARLDQLWASFKQDTSAQSHGPTNSNLPLTETEATPTKKMKIQKTYDFAGEEVLVEKEVSADSKEAKSYLQSHVKSTGSDSDATLTVRPTTSFSQATLQGNIRGSTKRTSGLSSVLKSLGKKSKMSTLEKSSLDWKKYKQDEGLEEELAQNSKDGYLAKQEFLEWSDMKQFELERNERLKQFKRLK